MGQTNRYSHDVGTTNLLGLHKSGNMQDSWEPWGLNCSVNWDNKESWSVKSFLDKLKKQQP